LANDCFFPRFSSEHNLVNQKEIHMTDKNAQALHIFEMELSTNPETVLLHPEAAASINDQLPVDERAVFDASLQVFDFDGTRVLGLSRRT
jgi:hypothetical protein